MMYKGKTAAKLAEQKKKKQRQAAKAEIEKNVVLIKDAYENFQSNLSEFAKRHKNEIKQDAGFREKFNEMCQQFDVNPMLAEKNIWAELGFGDYYHNLAMLVLDICAKNRHANGGIMRISDITHTYHRKEKRKITSKDVIRAMEKTYVLGNASVIDGKYVCTVPVQLGANLTLLLDLATRHGFISKALLKKQKGWNEEEFDRHTGDLRAKGVLWVDKSPKKGPHYYFLSHLGTDFTQFAEFMKQY